MNLWKRAMGVLACAAVLAAGAQSATVSGTITAVQGQRVEVTASNGTRQWFSVQNADANLDASFVGMKVSAEVTRMGDALVLRKPKFTR